MSAEYDGLDVIQRGLNIPIDIQIFLEVEYSGRVDYIISYIGNGRVTYRDLGQLQSYLLAPHLYPF